MKINLLKTLTTGATALAAALFASSCQDYTPEFDMNKMEHEAFEASGISDFSMTRVVALDLDFQSPGAKNPMWVYTQNPFDEEGELIKDVKPISAFFLQDGTFHGSVSLPKAYDRLYVVAGGIGLPTVTEFDVYDNVAVSRETLTRSEAYRNVTLDKSGGELSSSDYPTTIAAANRSQIITTTNNTYNTPELNSVLDAVGPKLVPLYPWSISGYPCPNNQIGVAYTGTWQNQVGKTDNSSPWATYSPNKFLIPDGKTLVLNFKNYSDKAENWHNWVLELRGTSNNSCYLDLRADNWAWVPGNDGFQLTADGKGGTCNYDENTFKNDMDGAKVTLTLSRDGRSVAIKAVAVSTTGKVLQETYTHTCSGSDDIQAQLVVDHSHIVMIEQECVLLDATPAGGYDMQSKFCSFDKDGNDVEIGGNWVNITKFCLGTVNAVPVDDYSIKLWDASKSLNCWYPLDGENGSWFQFTIPAGTSEKRICLFTDDVPQLVLKSVYAENVLDTDGETVLHQAGEPDGTVDVLMADNKLDSENFHTAHWRVMPGTYRVYAQNPTSKNKVFGIRLRPSAWEEDGIAYYNSIHFEKAGNYDDDGVMIHSELDNASKNEGINMEPSFAKTDATKIIKSTQHDTYPDQCEVPANIHQSGNSAQMTFGQKFQSSNGAKIQVKVPDGTLAKLTLVFSEGQDASFKLDDESQARSHGGNQDLSGKGSPRNVITTLLNAGTHTINRNKDNILFYMRLDYEEPYSLHETAPTQMVKTLKNVTQINSEPIADVKNRLTNTLWRGTGSKANAKSIYGDGFNKSLTSADESKNNIIVKTDNTKLSVTFLDEYDMTASNTFGYYYYEKNNEPQTVEDIKNMFIVFPNCTSTNYSNSSKYKDYMYDKNADPSSYRAYRDEATRAFAPLHTGDQVDLAFYGYNGDQDMSLEFPANCVVGWFVIYNGFDAWSLLDRAARPGDLRTGLVRLGAINNYYEGRQQPQTYIYFSNPKFNTYVPTTAETGAQARCIQMTDSQDERIVSLCFEDSYPGDSQGVSDGHRGTQDFTYDDLIITLSANQPIENPSGNKTGDDDDVVNTYNETGTLLFEDIWDGNRTDFDMNDVVIEYNRVWSVKQDGNKYTQVSETYTMINDGGTYQDGFAIKTPYTKNQVESVTITVGESSRKITEINDELVRMSGVDQHTGRIELDGNNDNIVIILFDDINEVRTNTRFNFLFKFKDADAPSISNVVALDGTITSFEGGFQREAYNPFVIVYNYDLGANYSDKETKRCEIHLANKDLTSRGIESNAWAKNPNNNRWNVARIGEDGLYVPFGLDLAGVTSFVSCKEEVLVTEGFPYFAAWAKDETGKTQPTWYTNKVSSNIGWEPIGTVGHPQRQLP